MEDANALLKSVAQRGWPSATAITAAIVLHATVMAWLTAHPPTSAPRDRAIAVALLLTAPAIDTEPEPVPATSPSGRRADDGEADHPVDSPDPLESNGRAGAASTSPSGPAIESPMVEATRPPAHADRPKRRKAPTSSRSEPAPRHADRIPEKAEDDASADLYTREGTQKVPEGTAVYRVFIGARGNIQSIGLARSSGTVSLDEAGIGMIRSTMTFDPPSELPGTVMIVTIHFSRDRD